MKNQYIAVCTPARDMVHTMFTYDLVNMVCHHTLNTNDAVSLKISEGTLIANQRAELSLDAMREGCSHLLFVDSDMRFPQDMISRLLAHDLDIVAANCARRRMPTGPTAQIYKENGDRELVWSMPESTGLQDVFFCNKARAAGFKIWIDHDVSKEIGHVGTFEFKHDHTWVIKDLEKEKAP